MQPEQLIKAFTATVQSSLLGLQSIAPVLQREQDALSGKDPDLLNQIVAEKLTLLQQLEHGIQARDRLQKAAGLEAGLEGGRKFVDILGHDALARDWTQLTTLAQAVADQNDRNGQLAMHGQRATRTALGILTGRSDTDDTYSSLRHKRGAAARYSLGRV